MAHRRGVGLRAKPALAFAIILFLFAGLIGLGAANGWIAGIDRICLLALGVLVSGHAALARAITHLGDPVARIGIVMLATIGVLVARRPRDALFLVLTVASGSLVISVLKADVARARPTLLPHLDVVHNASFPSGHAANSAIVYGAIALVLRATRAGRPLSILAVVIVLLVGLSRIGLAVHWPSDVVAGWAIGAGWLLLAHAARQASPWRDRR